MISPLSFGSCASNTVTGSTVSISSVSVFLAVSYTTLYPAFATPASCEYTSLIVSGSSIFPCLTAVAPSVYILHPSYSPVCSANFTSGRASLDINVVSNSNDVISAYALTDVDASDNTNPYRRILST